MINQLQFASFGAELTVCLPRPGIEVPTKYRVPTFEQATLDFAHYVGLREANVLPHVALGTAAGDFQFHPRTAWDIIKVAGLTRETELTRNPAWDGFHQNLVYGLTTLLNRPLTGPLSRFQLEEQRTPGVEFLLTKNDKGAPAPRLKAELYFPWVEALGGLHHLFLEIPRYQGNAELTKNAKVLFLSLGQQLQRADIRGIAAMFNQLLAPEV